MSSRYLPLVFDAFQTSSIQHSNNNSAIIKFFNNSSQISLYLPAWLPDVSSLLLATFLKFIFMVDLEVFSQLALGEPRFYVSLSYGIYSSMMHLK